MTGSERIRPRRMKENFWEFEPTHKAIIVANHRPEIRGTDTGIWRRIKLVPFDVEIPEHERNPHLMEELQEEQEGILAWMLQGALQWRHLGLNEPEPIKAATQDYRDDMDVLANFILTKCVEGPGVSVSSTALYNEYRKWAEESGEFVLSQTKFSTRLQERGYVKKHSKRGRVWYEIGLRHDDGPGGDDPNPSLPRVGGLYEKTLHNPSPFTNPSLLENLEEGAVVALDVESTGLNPWNGELPTVLSLYGKGMEDAELFWGPEIEKALELAAPRLDQLPHLGRFVGREVVHDHNVSGLQGRRQDVLYVSIEDFSVGGALNGHRLAHPAKGDRGQKRGVFAAIAWNLQVHAFAFSRVTIQGREGGVHSHFIYEHQLLGVDLRGHHNPPGGPYEFVSLCGALSPFLRVEPIRAMTRHMVERLTESPLIAFT
jgi:hypothetical protein